MIKLIGIESPNIEYVNIIINYWYNKFCNCQKYNYKFKNVWINDLTNIVQTYVIRYQYSKYTKFKSKQYDNINSILNI